MAKFDIYNYLPFWLNDSMHHQFIRNFCIIAHIDHGKSTLADRILELTGTIPKEKMREQVLDRLELERLHGVTIKLTPVRIKYNDYILNLIDTPGHVDFAYEVERTIACCEAALLLVDATQGIQAQTQAHLNLAKEHHLTIIPIINKIDLPAANIDEVKGEIEKVLNIDTTNLLLISAKKGIGIEEVLGAIIKYVPPPTGSEENPLKALIFDSVFIPYKGCIPYIRVFEGKIERGMRIRLMHNNAEFEVSQVGIFTPEMQPVDKLSAGEVGYVIANIKEPQTLTIGDTITDARKSAGEPLPGYKKLKPVVFCGFYPEENKDYAQLNDALNKLQLNDSAFTFEPESSSALGAGFRCGFLGLFHREIVQERLEQEYNLNVVATSPNVVYKVYDKKGTSKFVDNPTKLPSQQDIAKIEEPYIDAVIITKVEHLSNIIELCKVRRGELLQLDYLSSDKVILKYRLPLAEVIFDFYDKLKSLSAGYASLDYDFFGYKESELVRLDILIANERVDVLTTVVHKDKAYNIARELVKKLRETIPRQLFDVNIQAAIGSKIIAKEVVKQLRKDVIAKCYGGDVTRKKKLLEKQKLGKKRMKKVGKVQLPQEAFLAILKV